MSAAVKPSESDDTLGLPVETSVADFESELRQPPPTPSQCEQGQVFHGLAEGQTVAPASARMRTSSTSHPSPLFSAPSPEEKWNSIFTCAPAYALKSTRRACQVRSVQIGPLNAHNCWLNPPFGPPTAVTFTEWMSQELQQYSESTRDWK